MDRRKKMEAKSEKNDKGGIPGKVTRPVISEVSANKILSACPECYGELRFGSRDPCEGDYWFCSVCGYGPILFPLFGGPVIKQITNARELLGIIDADKMNESLRDVAILKSRPVVH
jgi:hypothetical protein